MFSERSPPPTSKDFLEKLEQKVVRDQGSVRFYFPFHLLFVKMFYFFTTSHNL
jgi:hypothetical protein